MHTYFIASTGFGVGLTSTSLGLVRALERGGSGKPGHLSVLGALAAEVTARAVLNAVRAAHGLDQPPLPSARDLGLT